MAETKRRRFLYKRAQFLKATGTATDTLESLLKKAMKKAPTALSRFENPAGSDIEKRFINYSLLHSGKDGNGSIYGCEFLAFDEGEVQSTIQIDPNATEISVDAIKAGKGMEFLAGAVYVGIIGNHVVVCQSRGLKAKDLESYLNWFLVQKTKVLDGENRVSLTDHIPKKKKALFKGVKGIEIKAPVILTPSAATEKQAAADSAASEKAKEAGKKGEVVAEKKTHSYPVKLAGKAWDAVKALVGDSFQLPDEISVGNLADTPDIEVQIFLKWKGQHHETDDDFLDGVASNMRHIDDELDYEVRGSSGTMSRDDIKIFKDFSLSWTKSGRPRFDDFFPKMAEWLAALDADGKIDP